MKLKNPEDNRSIARDRQTMPAGPARLARLLKMVENDLSGLPLAANPPAEVAAAHQAFVAAVALAKQIAAKVDEAEEAAAEAGKADVAAAVKVAQAGGAGKLPEPTRTRKAAGAVEAALVGCEAAEKLVEDAHDHFVESVKDEWVTWRAEIVQAAAAAHAVAVEAMEKATAAVASARGLYAGVGSLDNGVLSRYPKIAEAVGKEQRGSLAWYASTGNGQPPLQRVSVPGVSSNGRPHVSDLSVVVEALRLAVAAPADFAAGGEWLPPGDPEHDALRDTPLDLEATWVVAAVRRDWGSTCAFCRLPHADTVVQDGSTLVLVHGECREPDAKEKKRQDARAAMSRRGYDAQPGQEQHWQR